MAGFLARYDVVQLEFQYYTILSFNMGNYGDKEMATTRVPDQQIRGPKF